MEKASTSSSWERAQQLYNKNVGLENKRQKSLQAKIPSDPNAWYQIRENYEAIILEDHSFSEQHNIEFSLWQLHYKRIEEFRAHFSAAQASVRSSTTNNGKGPPQVDRVTKIRVQFKAFLSEATGFYHDLIIKIRAKYGLPLGHFSEDSDSQAVVGPDTGKSSDAKKGLVSCHRCLIYLGDIARYKGLYGEGESRVREYSAASSYYLQAASLWPSNGNPHHQLAILATYSSDELVAVYRYFRSLAAEIPFSTAKDNLVIVFEKNRHSYTQLLETTKSSGNREVSMKEKYKEFCTQFVRLNGILFSRTSLETFTVVLSSVSGAFHVLLSSGPEEEQNFGADGMENGLAILRLIAILIFTVQNVNKKNEGQSYAEILQHNVLFENACNVTFKLVGLIVERCLNLRDPSSSFLLPGILVFLEWLAFSPEIAAYISDEKKPTVANSSFWKNSVALFNKLLSSGLVSVDDDGDETCFTNMGKYEEGEAESRLALWEDFELRGFSPLLPAQNILDFSRMHSNGVGGSTKEKQTRIKRIIAAGKALASIAMVDQKVVIFDPKSKQFVIGIQPQVFESLPTEQEIATLPANSLAMRENVELLFGGEDEDEEIVFKPTLVEKQIDLHNSTRLVEQHTSLVDDIKKLRFLENGHVPKTDSKGALGVLESGSLLPTNPSVGFMDTAIYSNYTRTPEVMAPSKMVSIASFSEFSADNVAIKPPPISSATSKSQVNRPVRHLGPPPGFSPVPPKQANMPMSNMVGTNGSLVLDDYSWLDGHQMPFSVSNIGPNHANQVSLGNTQFINNSNISNGNSGLPFLGSQASNFQFQGGNFKGYPEYQSIWNPNPNHGHKLSEQQQHTVMGNEFTSQGQSTWNGRYRV